MRWHLYKMGIVGIVAVCNMVAVGTCWILNEWVFERGNSAIQSLLLILHTPLALLAAAQRIVAGMDVWVYALSVPLNAYFWGFIVGGVVRLVRAFRPSEKETSKPK